MTGRDLIIYILQHDLENEKVFENGRFLGCLTIDDVANQTHTGPFTVKAWIELGMIEYIKVGDDIYIPADYHVVERGEDNER